MCVGEESEFPGAVVGLDCQQSNVVCEWTEKKGFGEV